MEEVTGSSPVSPTSLKPCRIKRLATRSIVGRRGSKKLGEPGMYRIQKRSRHGASIPSYPHTELPPAHAVDSGGCDTWRARSLPRRSRFSPKPLRISALSEGGLPKVIGAGRLGAGLRRVRPRGAGPRDRVVLGDNQVIGPERCLPAVEGSCTRSPSRRRGRAMMLRSSREAAAGFRCPSRTRRRRPRREAAVRGTEQVSAGEPGGGGG